MSLSLGSSQFSPPYAPPAVPDIHGCDPWYFKANDTADINDCKVAFELLPQGADLIEWVINGDPVHTNNSYQLPYNSSFGTCEIKLYASGPSAPELNHYPLSPTSLRQLAGYLLQSCLLATEAGGFITSGLQNTLSTITQPTFSHLQPYPQNSTYLSLSISSNPSHHPLYNPGNMDPLIAHAIVTATLHQKQQTRIRTPAWRNAIRNYLYYESISAYMQRSWYSTWWSPPQPHGTAPVLPLSENQSNETLPMQNITTLPSIHLNASIPGGEHACQISTEQSENSNQRCLSRDAHNETAGGLRADSSSLGMDTVWNQANSQVEEESERQGGKASPTLTAENADSSSTPGGRLPGATRDRVDENEQEKKITSRTSMV